MTLTLPSRETWGERLHRAYRVGREEYGYTYDSVAKQLSKIGHPVSPQTLMRLEYLASPPSTARQKLNAWLFITAIGFDPADLGVAPPMKGLVDWDKVRAELDPAKWIRQAGVSPARSRWSSCNGAGPSPFVGATT